MATSVDHLPTTKTRYRREKSVYIAEMAIKAKRYDDVIEEMNRVELMEDGVLTIMEWGILMRGYMLAVESRRGSLKILLELEEEGPEEVEEEEVARHFNEYKKKLKSEFIKICREFLSKIDKHFDPSKFDPKQFVLTYKIKGDFHKYLAEVKACDDNDTNHADESLKAYEDAKLRVEELNPLDVIRMQLALSSGVLHYEILQDHQKALEIVKQATKEADAYFRLVLHKSELNKYKDSFPTLKLLKAQIKQWESTMPDKKGQGQFPIPDTERESSSSSSAMALHPIYLAHWAMKAERYDDVVKEMRKVEEMGANELKLLILGYSKLIAERMHSWRIISQLDPEQGPRDEKQKEKFKEYFSEYKKRVELEIIGSINHVLSVIDKVLALQFIAEDEVANVAIFQKMKGDLYKFLCELYPMEEYFSKSKQAYEAAKSTANLQLPFRLRLAEAYSELYIVVKHNTERACEIAQDAIDAARSEGAEDSIVRRLEERITQWKTVPWMHQPIDTEVSTSSLW